MSRVRALWNGEVPLADAFWNWTIIYGSFLNLLTTAGALAAITLGWPGWLAVVIFFLPLPYNFLMVVAVWKSAARYAGGAFWAQAARIAVVIWAAIATLA
jgi:hypothetical protein